MSDSIQLERLMLAFSGGIGEAMVAFQQALPTAPNPFNNLGARVNDVISAIREERQEAEFHFGGVQHKHLLDRFRLENAMHVARPDIFEKPPAIDWPPYLAHGEDPFSDGNLRELFQANAYRLPSNEFVLELPAYRLSYRIDGYPTERSYLRAYGECVETTRASSRAFAVSKGVIIVAFTKWIGCEPAKLVTRPSSVHCAHYELLRKAAAVVRDAAVELYGLYDEDKDREKLIREIRDVITREIRYYTPNMYANDLWWRGVYFKLQTLAPELVEYWAPVTFKETTDGTANDSES
jgi:hypothetical protein